MTKRRERSAKTSRDSKHRRIEATYSILGHAVKKLFDLISVVVLELEPSPLHTLLESQRLLGDQVLVEMVDLLVLLSSVLEGSLDEVGLSEVEVDVGRGVDEKLVESLSRPLETRIQKKRRVSPGWVERRKARKSPRDETNLDGVLDSVRETLERAHGNALLGGILTRRVGFGEVRNDDLDVGFGSEGSRFEERLSVEDASTIHVLTCEGKVKETKKEVGSVSSIEMETRRTERRRRKRTSDDVVESVGDSIELGEESISVDVYRKREWKRGSAQLSEGVATRRGSFEMDDSLSVSGPTRS